MPFPFYKQLDQVDCGSTSLRMVAKFYGQSYTADQIRKYCYVTRGGTSMMGISHGAEVIGLHTQAVRRLDYKTLATEAILPVILHWGQNHFVLLHKIKKRKRKSDIIHVADPAHGLLQYNEKQFMQQWVQDEKQIGIALLIEPTPDFYREEPGKPEKINFKYLLSYLRPYRKFIIQLFLGLIVGSIISLIFPYLTQSIVDVGINNRDLGFVALILLAQLMLTLGQTANNLIRNWISLHVTTRVSISLIANFLAKLMRLPIAYFDTKMIGDIMQRIGDHRRIQTFLTKSLINIMFAAITLVLYSFVLSSYSLTILMVFSTGSILYMVWILIFLKKRRDLDFKRFQEEASNQGNLVQLVSGMQEIKLNNAEKRKRWEWERIQARLFKVSVSSLILNQNQQVGTTLIDQAKNILISFLSVQAVIQGEMTLGMMVAIQYIIGQLNAPIQQFIGFSQQIQDAKISIERLSEIHEKEDEERLEDAKIRDIPKAADIDVKGVTFQYGGPYSEKALDEVTLNIPTGKITAIVGGSGSGKTTLVKLLLGFYEPTKGEINLKSLPLHDYSPGEWRKSCGVVMQDGFIFSDTIDNNISIIDDLPNKEKRKNAAHTANLEPYIESLPLRYNTKIGSDGHGLSSGQR